ncbi:hypothetical protein DM2_1738 [Halorubrum sp. DM2]|uniref:hypothetical protein n=1 Tax=Halorubrum sp. DM2 TaxID=2527867 RepID=UPI0024B6578C|nr:hypothetical protein [Halorubrum sp. DM2]VTT88404.1 hypothetical protein DM2_1738 [Halorubrum sp. DM2]
MPTLDFETDAHVDEYVVDAENTTVFAASDGELTYTRAGETAAVSVPVGDVNGVEFDRNDGLRRHTFLGLFFLVLSLVLTVGTVLLVYQGRVESPREIGLAAFLSVFVIGGWNTAYDLLSRSDRDVIDVYVTTEADTHVLCGEIGDAEFVNACQQLVDSRLPTTNRHPALEAELD